MFLCGFGTSFFIYFFFYLFTIFGTNKNREYIATFKLNLLNKKHTNCEEIFCWIAGFYQLNNFFRIISIECLIFGNNFTRKNRIVPHNYFQKQKIQENLTFKNNFRLTSYLFFV